MRKSAKIITALSVTGLAVVAGSAFTGAGLKNDQTTQFVGGTVAQSVTGATLKNLEYRFGDDATKRTVASVALQFEGESPEALLGKKVVLELAGSETGSSYTCPDLDINGYTTCSVSTTEGAVAQKNVTSASITVNNPA